MPPATKREHCNHAVMVKKAISFGKDEVEAVKRRDLTLPDHVLVWFCVQCWSVNPTQLTPRTPDEDEERMKSFESGPINGG